MPHGAPDVVSDVEGRGAVETGTPNEIISLLHREMVTILALPDVKERLPSLGFEVVASTPGEFATQIKAEIESWAKVIRAANIKQD
jgi:tripartite-type tricarboxylate transporter receptor subunit TctC